MRLESARSLIMAFVHVDQRQFRGLHFDLCGDGAQFKVRFKSERLVDSEGEVRNPQ
jgi:hypothetical protein